MCELTPSFHQMGIINVLILNHCTPHAMLNCSKQEGDQRMFGQLWPTLVSKLDHQRCCVTDFNI